MNYEQLKNSILQEAIEGLLVPQDPNDEPAAVLLDRIADEKKRLIKEKKIKRDRNESRIYRTNDGHWMERFSDKNRPEVCIDDEITFEIPENWVLARLSNISYDSADGPFGSNLKKEHYTSNKEVRIIQLSNIGEEGWKDNNVKYTTFEHLKNISRSEAFPGDIIIAKMMPAGRAIICPNLDQKYVLSSDAVRFNFSSSINREYLYYAINSNIFKEQVYKEVQGITRVRTSLKKLRSYIIPIPPYNEQKKIVDKIKQVLPKIEEFGKAQDRLNALNTALPEKLKASILQEAIEGRLVPQNPDDEPASKLLDRIAEEKAKLVKEKKIKVDKNASRIYRTDDGHWMEHFADKHRTDVCIDDEIPFDISEKWEWTRFGNVFDITMGQSPSGESLNKSKDGIEFHQGKILFTNEYLDVSNTYTNKPTKIAEENSLLLCVRAPVGIVNITKRNICIGRGLCSIKPLGNMPLLFFFYVIQTLKSDFEDRATGSTFKAISREIIYNELIPIPPIEEQKRIVEKIEAILPKLETLI